MLRPFSRFCVTIGAIPESIIKSLSYEQQLLRLIKFLKQTVIPAIDGNTAAIKEIENWIENVNLQAFVDNKLDEMVESGELQEIISEYLNSQAIFGYDTIDDMKEATNLIDGSYAKTLGYYSKNDGGAGLYKIRTVTNEDVVDDGSIIAMEDETLVAELIVTNSIDVKQFGAKGDNETDDTDKIKATFEFAEKQIIPDYTGNNETRSSHFKVTFGKGVYVISDTIIMNVQRFDVEGFDCIIKSTNGSKPAVQLIGGNAMTPDRVIKGIVLYNDSDNTTTSIGWYIGTETYGGDTTQTPASGFSLEECGATYFGTAYLVSHNAYTFSLENCTAYGNKYTIKSNGGLINSGENISIFNCVFTATTDTDVVVTSPNFQLRFLNTSFDQGHRLLDVNIPGTSYECNLITFDNCHFEPVALSNSYIYINTSSARAKVVIDKCTTFLKTTAQYLIENGSFPSYITIKETEFTFYDSYPSYIANNKRTQMIDCNINRNILSDPFNNLVIDTNMAVTSIDTDGVITSNGQKLCTNKCWIYLDKDTYNSTLEKSVGTFLTLTADSSVKPTGTTKSFKVDVNSARNNIVGFLAPYNGNGNVIKGKFKFYIPSNITGKIVVRAIYWNGATFENIGYPGTVYKTIDLATVETNSWIDIDFPTPTFKVPTDAKMIGFMLENQGDNLVTGAYTYYFGNVILQAI